MKNGTVSHITFRHSHFKFQGPPIIMWLVQYFVLILGAFILGIGGRSKFSVANNTITTSCKKKLKGELFDTRISYLSAPNNCAPTNLKDKSWANFCFICLKV